VDELGSLALPPRASGRPLARTACERRQIGESLDHLPRSQTETRRALGQTELHAIPEHTRRSPLGVGL
jgi:hypothetical protein